ncbi:hypothetical protein ACFXTN_017201 [Malus domestica]|uniref:Uncharacterized protein n=1 Tax=Malus domestica TaxID=3750 RepID=A0A498I2S3_MALDO|nr:hypothetical protein DVH24_030094 [Malus domestica]
MYGIGPGCCCFMKMGSGYDGATTLIAFRRATNGDGLVIGAGPRFQVYEVYLWGKPEGMRSESNNQLNRMVYLYQGKKGRRSIDVENSLQAPMLAKLEQDKG